MFGDWNLACPVSTFIGFQVPILSALSTLQWEATNYIGEKTNHLKNHRGVFLFSSVLNHSIMKIYVKHFRIKRLIYSLFCGLFCYPLQNIRTKAVTPLGAGQTLATPVADMATKSRLPTSKRQSLRLRLKANISPRHFGLCLSISGSTVSTSCFIESAEQCDILVVWPTMLT